MPLRPHRARVEEIKPGAGAHPHLPPRVLAEAAHVFPGVGHHLPEASSRHTYVGPSHVGGEPKPAPPVAKGALHAKALLPDVGSHPAHRGRKLVDAAAIGAHPQVAHGVDGQPHHRAFGEHLRAVAAGKLPEDGHRLGEEVDAAAIQACPHVVETVFQDAPHGAARELVPRMPLGDELAVEPQAGGIRPLGQVHDAYAVQLHGHPQLAVGQLLDVEHAMGPYLLLRHMEEALVGRVVDVEPVVGAHPYPAVPVLVERNHLVAGNAAGDGGVMAVVVGREAAGVYDGKPRPDMPHHDDAAANIERAPQPVVGHAPHIAYIIVAEASRLLVQVLHALPVGGDPQVAILGVRYVRDVVGGDAAGVLAIVPVASELVGSVIKGVEAVVLGAYPQHGVVHVVQHTVERAARHALRPVLSFVIAEESLPVKAIQPLFRGKPQESVLVLRSIHHEVARQALRQAQGPHLVALRQRPHCCQRKGEQKDESIVLCHSQVIFLWRKDRLFFLNFQSFYSHISCNARFVYPF